MSLTFPDARAIATTSAALAEGAYFLAMVLLAAGAACATIIYSDRMDQAWPLLAGFALVAVGGSVLRSWTRSPRVAIATAAAVILTGVWTAASAVTSLVPVLTLSSSSYFFSNLTVSVVFLGVLVRGSGRAPLAVTIAAAATQTIVLLAVATSGGQPRVDLPALAVWAVVTLVLVGLELRRRQSRSTAVDFARAETRTRDAADARRAAIGRAALLHDTVLSDLAALSALPPGALPARARARFLDTVGILRRGEAIWPLAEAEAQDTTSDALGDLLAHRPASAIPVQVSGDVAALDQVDSPARESLLLAVAQCLANVDLHSRARRAELFFGATETDVTVMVSDDGVGFDASSVPPEKLGLRNSVHARVEAVGGRAEVWSRTDGSGTTVVLNVPVSTAAARDRRSDAR